MSFSEHIIAYLFATIPILGMVLFFTIRKIIPKAIDGHMNLKLEELKAGNLRDSETIRQKGTQQLEDFKINQTNYTEETQRYIDDELERGIENLRSELNASEEVRKIKRAAILSALSVIDSHLCYVGLKINGKAIPISLQGKPSISKIRECANRLVLTCEEPNLYQSYLDIFLNPDKNTAVLEAFDLFRNTARKELGLPELKFDKTRTWIAWTPSACE